jgi:hypothetical protein
MWSLQLSHFSSIKSLSSSFSPENQFLPFLVLTISLLLRQKLVDIQV